MPLWIVRAGKRGEHESLALEEDLVVIGWRGLPDLSACGSRAEIEALLRKRQPDARAASLVSQATQIYAFVRRIDEDDLVMLPLKTNRGRIAVGRVIGPYQHRPDMPVGANHARPVEWVEREVQRERLDDDIQRSLNAYSTVCCVRKDAAEARVATAMGLS